MFTLNIIPQNASKINTYSIYFGGKDMKSLSIRIDETMLDKLHVVADYEGRSANSEILILIRREIERYETQHGEIQVGQKKN